MLIDEKKCYICGNSRLNKSKYINAHFSFLEKNNRNVFEELFIYSCPECGFSYASPFLDESDLSSFYESDYGAEGGPHYQFKHINFFKKKNYINTRWLSQFLLANNYINIKEVKNFLDIGADVGCSFLTLKKLGVKANFFALEKGLIEVEELRKSNVVVLEAKDRYLNIDKKYREYFDLILMSHVLEHFNADCIEPILLNVKRYLKNGGIFICEIPNDDCKRYDIKGENHAPHLCFFSKTALEKMLNKLDFEILFISTVGGERISQRDMNASDFHANPLQKIKKILKKIIYRSKTVSYIYKFFRLYLFRIIEFEISYHKQQKEGFYSIFNSPDFQYSKNRSSIRLCARKKLQI